MRHGEHRGAVAQGRDVAADRLLGLRVQRAGDLVQILIQQAVGGLSTLSLETRR